MQIEGITIEAEKNDEKIIKRVRAKETKVCIYGCGDIGVMVYEYLRVNGIRVNFYVVDDDYYSFDECYEVPVRKFSSLPQIKEHIDVFVGLANVNKALKKLENFGSDIGVYCISNPCLYLRKYSIDCHYYRTYKTEFEKAYSFFEDELSKKIFTAYLNTRINQNYKYMLPFGEGTTYFNEEIFELSDNEVYVDCGAYNGDSIKSFLKSVDAKYKKIYAVEPDENNFSKIKECVINNKIENIVLLNKGAWKEKDILCFSENGGQEGSITERKTENRIKVDALDNMIQDEKVTLLKMSVQGAEENALIGAERILKKDEPKLAVTIFMKPNALIKITQVIKEINPKYKLYLRCEEAFFAKVILYAKVER